MSNPINRNYIWSGKKIKCNVLYSRAGIATQILINNINNNSNILIDCGDGSTRDILNVKIDLNSIKNILISHGHPDHIGGMFSLLSTFRLFRVNGHINIYAPTNCTEVKKIITLFLELYKQNLSFTLEYKEIKENTYLNIEEFHIKAFPALHYESTKNYIPDRKLKPAVGYKIKLDNETIVYSGDTLPNPSLEKEIQNASLALIEATYDENFSEKEQNHLNTKYASKIAKTAKKYFLIHRF